MGDIKVHLLSPMSDDGARLRVKSTSFFFLFYFLAVLSTAPVCSLMNLCTDIINTSQRVLPSDETAVTSQSKSSPIVKKEKKKQ